MRTHRHRLTRLFLNLGLPPAEAGFTLVELLVAMLLMGALAAIALPSFASYLNRSKEARANVHLSAVNRAQQAYRLENSSFAGSLSDLGLATADSDYTYTVAIAARSHVIVEAQPKSDDVKGFTGVAYVLDGGINSAICEGTPGQVPGECEADDIDLAIAYIASLEASASAGGASGGGSTVGGSASGGAAGGGSTAGGTASGGGSSSGGTSGGASGGLSGGGTTPAGSTPGGVTGGATANGSPAGGSGDGGSTTGQNSGESTASGSTSTGSSGGSTTGEASGGSNAGGSAPSGASTPSGPISGGNSSGSAGSGGASVVATTPTSIPDGTCRDTTTGLAIDPASNTVITSITNVAALPPCAAPSSPSSTTNGSGASGTPANAGANNAPVGGSGSKKPGKQKN